MLELILVVFAFVLAIVAALIPPWPAWPGGRLHLGWLALALFIAAFLFGHTGMIR